MTGTSSPPATRSDTQDYAYAPGVHWTGEKIRREREARGLSQEQLAHLLSAAQTDNTTSTRSITAWENNESRPSGRNLAALDRVLAPHDTTGPTLTEATELELLAELARRLGIAGRLPDRDLRLPRRNRSDTYPPSQGETGAGG
jgi:transcriptional regulator with XRE-family HTH domain